MNWRLDLILTNLLFLDASEKFLSLICFANNLYALYNRLNTSRLAQFRKTMKICESVKRNTLSLISKATFTKTAINPKFIDGFSLQNLSAAIDQCTTKSPNFVSIENFLSCTNIRAKLSKYCSNFIDLAKFLLWDFLLYRAKLAQHQFPCSTREFTALGCAQNAMEREKKSEYRLRRATKRRCYVSLIRRPVKNPRHL